MTVPEHLERHVGRIEGGWTQDADGQDVPFQVVRLGGGPVPGTLTFSTLGLNRHSLHSSATGKPIRQELVIVVPAALRDAPIPGLLQEIGREAVDSGHALLRGSVVGPRGPIFPGSRMEALYASVPVVFPDGFGTVRENGNEVVMVWLIPISRVEATDIARHGWSAFEERLEASGVDVTDPGRPLVSG